jgi:hypothetical protein
MREINRIDTGRDDASGRIDTGRDDASGVKEGR